MSSNPDLATLAPFRLEPLFVERIWGTPDLRPWYDHVTEAATGHNPIGEVWLTGDDCLVASGILAGQSLSAVFAEHSRAMLGSQNDSGASPLLLKVIFAREKLSVQVHPDDRLAQKYGNPRGKTECWYVLAAQSDARVAVGLLPGVTLAQVERGVTDGTLEEHLQSLPVATGEMIFVDAGTVHAIWPGSVLLETQQNCDLTYRLYDYGRPRELHVAKALEAIRLETAAGKVVPEIVGDQIVLVESAYFCVEKMMAQGSIAGASHPVSGTDSGTVSGVGSGVVSGQPGLQYLFAASGQGIIRSAINGEFETVDLQPRQVVVVPASSPAWTIEDAGGLDLIRITPRFPADLPKGIA